MTAQPTDMTGKVCVVTGANSGIGKETALALATMGAQVVMVCRSQERGAAAQAEIRARSGHDAVDLLIADLSSQAEVRRLAGDFKARYDRLDALVNNAGVFLMTRQESTDGLEMTFATNHLGYFLLTHLLLDVLKASAPARIVNVASAAHAQVRGSMNFDDLQGRRRFSGWGAYNQSKLANVLFTYELAERLAGTGVTVNALHPGFVATHFGRTNSPAFNVLMRIPQLFARSPARGALTSIYLASSPDVEGVTGKYFVDCIERRSSPASYDVAARQRLWQISEELTGLTV